MMEALAAAGEEALDEAPRPRALDQLDLEIADGEVGPEKLWRVPVAYFPWTIQARRKVLEEEGERPIDRAHRDRDVIDAKLWRDHRRKLREPRNRVNSRSRLDFRAQGTTVSARP